MAKDSKPAHGMSIMPEKTTKPSVNLTKKPVAGSTS